MKEFVYLFAMIVTLIIVTLSCSKKKPPESSKPVEPAPLSSPIPKPSQAGPMRTRSRRRRGRYPLTEMEDVFQNEEDVKKEEKKEMGDENEGWIREEDYLARMKKEGKKRVEPEDHRIIEKFDGEGKKSGRSRKSKKSKKSKKSEKKVKLIPMPPMAKEQLITNGPKTDNDYPLPDIKSDWGSEDEKKMEAEEEKKDGDSSGDF
ncbi:Protein CBG26536 [Caenorhabditis briggsae]|nr:Protein CBG26536 [Caenorhabditis briggsae]ULT97996.1 hypothetical protein L3Y34_005672 [Caenorhabditis briggsae]CAS00974.1 Protein CBG26536 [Caenorhabditis briggsae]